MTGRFFAAATALTLVFSFFSCSGASRDYFTYRRFPLTLYASATVNDTNDGETSEYELSLTMTDETSGTLEFLPPSALDGLRVSVNLLSGGDSAMEYDGLSIPTAYGIAQLAEAAVTVFSLTDYDMVSAEVDGEGSTIVAYRKDEADFTVALSPDGIPLEMRISIPRGCKRFFCIAGSDITLEVRSLEYGQTEAETAPPVTETT